MADPFLYEARKEPWPLRVPNDGMNVVGSTGLAHHYLSCFYWTVTTLMKVPWIAPETLAEKLFTSVMIFIGAILFAAILGDVTGIVQASTQVRRPANPTLRPPHLNLTSTTPPDAGLGAEVRIHLDPPPLL